MTLRREGADRARPGRPWSLPLEVRVLLLAAYWRTNLTLRQPAPLFGVSKSAADRIMDHTASLLALKQTQRLRKSTVLIADGTLVPPGTMPSPSSRRTIATPRITRSSSTPTPGWSFSSGTRCLAIAVSVVSVASPG
jgi:hypothetical protein